MASKRSRNLRVALGVGVGVVAVGAAAVAFAVHANYTRTGLRLQAWEESKDGVGRLRNLVNLLHEVADKGVEPAARAKVWPFLLGVFSPMSSDEERHECCVQLSNRHQALTAHCQDLEQQLADTFSNASMAAAEGATSQGSEVASELVQFAEAHRIIVLDAIRTNYSAAADELQAVQHGPAGWNADPSQVPWCSSTAQAALDAATHMDGYARHQCKRLIALLTAYAVHDRETGYCQGMSDLALPFLLVCEDDSQAFWAFEALMRRARRNFAVDESGIFAQLRALAGILEACDVALTHRLRTLGAADCHFAYRMVVVMLRREMALHKVAMLWEMSWAEELVEQIEAGGPGRPLQTIRPASGPAAQDASRLQAVVGSSAPVDSSELTLVMLFVAAVVCSQKRTLLDDCRDNDQVLQHFTRVRVDFWRCVRKARELRARLHQQAAAAAESGGR